MSTALEAARRAIEAHPAYDCGSTGDEEMARAAITAYLAHLAGDEAVVERMASAIMKVQGYEVLHQDTPDVDDQTIAAFEDAYDCAKEEARAALKTLAGKE